MPENYQELWGENGLTRFAPDSLLFADIPDEAKRFLSQVGLPTQSAIPANDPFVVLPLVLEQTHKHFFLDDSFHAMYYLLGEIAYDFDCGIETYFGIKKREGTIHLFDSEDPEALLVNASIPCFVSSLFYYQKFVDTLPSEPHHLSGAALHKQQQKERALFKHLRKDLLLVDAKSVRRRNSYWAVMLEDLAVQ